MKPRKVNTAQISLGEGWRQFAFPQVDVEFIGVIRRGMEIGALAQDRTGAFLQVNGDMRQVLNKSRVQALLRSAKPAMRPTPVARQPSAEQRAAVVVTVRQKRRRITSSD